MVLRFLDHPVIEIEPRKLPVDVPVRTLAIDHVGGRVRHDHFGQIGQGGGGSGWRVHVHDPMEPGAL